MAVIEIGSLNNLSEEDEAEIKRGKKENFSAEDVKIGELDNAFDELLKDNKEEIQAALGMLKIK